MNPLIFTPLYKERIWGGRTLASHFGRSLPSETSIGESWEIVDREDAQSVVSAGALAGKTLQELWKNFRSEIFGERYAAWEGRFPLLCKILDARDRLSVQVHPPATIASQLHGEPKTEMWYFFACDSGSLVYAGLRPGTTRDDFEHKLRTGEIEDCIQALPTQAGDSIFIPSGRLHAIGGGNLIAEIQQNSDTTYRVFDWNRVGLDGKPRELHIEKALLSTDFSDLAPTLHHTQEGTLAVCPYFCVERHVLTKPKKLTSSGDFAIVTMVSGQAQCGEYIFHPGDFFLLPAHKASSVTPLDAPCSVLVTTIPQANATKEIAQ